MFRLAIKKPELKFDPSIIALQVYYYKTNTTFQSLASRMEEKPTIII